LVAHDHDATPSKPLVDIRIPNDVARGKDEDAHGSEMVDWSR